MTGAPNTPGPGALPAGPKTRPRHGCAAAGQAPGGPHRADPGEVEVDVEDVAVSDPGSRADSSSGVSNQRPSSESRPSKNCPSLVSTCFSARGFVSGQPPVATTGVAAT